MYENDDEIILDSSTNLEKKEKKRDDSDVEVTCI